MNILMGLRKTILTSILLCFVAFAYSQAPTTEGVRKNPEFVGGNAGVVQYLSKNIVYPEDAKAKKAQAKVIVKFMVNIDGSVTNVEVKQLVKIKTTETNPATGQTTELVLPDKDYESLKKEAIRVVKTMPKWKPGSLNGQPARVEYSLPINFKM